MYPVIHFYKKRNDLLFRIDKGSNTPFIGTKEESGTKKPD